MLPNLEKAFRSRPVFLGGGALAVLLVAGLATMGVVSPLNRRQPVPSVDGKYFAYFGQLTRGWDQQAGPCDLVIATSSGAMVARYRLDPGWLSWSNAGDLLVVNEQRHEATLVPNTAGTFIVLTTLSLAPGAQPRWSRSGTKLAYVRSGRGGPQIAVYDLLQTQSVEVPLPAGFRLLHPILLSWSPGGEELFFINRQGEEVSLDKLNIFSGALQVLAQAPAGWAGTAVGLPHISPEGARFYLPPPLNSVMDAETGQTLWTLPAGARALESPWSADGNQMYYVRPDGLNRGRIFVHDFPTGSDRVLLSGVDSHGFFSLSGQSYFFRIPTAPPLTLWDRVRAWRRSQWGWQQVDVVTHAAQPMGRRELWPWEQSNQGAILMSQDDYSRVRLGLYQPDARTFSAYRFPTEHEEVVGHLKSHATLLFALFFYAFLGFFVYLKRPGEASARALYVFSLVLGIFFAGLHLLQTLPSSYHFPGEFPFGASTLEALGWLPLLPRAGLVAEKFFLCAFGMALLPPALLHFAAAFPEGDPSGARSRGLRGALYAAAFLPAAGMVAAASIPSFPYELRSLMFGLSAIGGGGAVIFLVLGLWRAFRHPPNRRVRAQVRWVAMGFALPLMGMGVLVIAQRLFAGGQGNASADGLSLLFLFTPWVAGLSLVARKLPDVQLLALRLLRYAAWTALIVSVYVLLAGGLALALGRSLSRPSGLVLVISALLTASVLAPVRRRVGEAIERTIGRRNYALREALTDFAAQLPQVLDRRTLAEKMDRMLRQAMKTETFWLFVLDRRSRKLRPQAPMKWIGGSPAPMQFIGGVEFDPAEPLCRYLIEKAQPFEVEVSPYDRQLIPLFQSVSDRLSRLRGAVIFGLERRGELLGLMIAGNKASGEFYNTEELDLLSAIARQAARAVEKTEIFEDVSRIREPAPPMQFIGETGSAPAQFFPASCPPTGDFQISAQSVRADSARPATESYSEVLSLPGKKIGLVMADVSAEGRSAPALMSHLQRTVRVLAQEAESIADLVRGVNRQVFTAPAKAKYCTLFYGVYDPSDRRLEYVNAGHPPPLLIGPRKKRFLDATGVTLGRFAEVSHETRREYLEPGSAALLYSEGVTGARNRRDEPFGEERLLKAALGASDLEAAPFAQRLLDELRAFADGRPPENDLTLLVLKVSVI